MFKPNLVAIGNESLLNELKEALADCEYMPEIIPGEQGVIEVRRHFFSDPIPLRNQWFALNLTDI